MQTSLDFSDVGAPLAGARNVGTPLAGRNVGAPLAGALVQVEVTDNSLVARTVATYTHGNGVWQTVDLVQTEDDPNLWLGQLPHQPFDKLRAAPGLAYFVQAVDKGGNVAIYDNKGRYISLPTLYLPLVTHNP